MEFIFHISIGKKKPEGPLAGRKPNGAAYGADPSTSLRFDSPKMTGFRIIGDMRRQQVFRLAQGDKIWSMYGRGVTSEANSASNSLRRESETCLSARHLLHVPRYTEVLDGDCAGGS